MDSSSLAHCKWECQYHIVFIPKFRKKKLYGTVRDDVRDIIKTLSSYKKVEIIAGKTVTISAFAKEGLINQHTAKKAIDRFTSALCWIFLESQKLLKLWAKI